MRKPEYKIVPVSLLFGNVAGGTGYQVRRLTHPGGTPLWADAGEPCNTRPEAEAKITAFLERDANEPATR